MKFKTIVITKKRIMAVFSVITAVGVCAVIAKFNVPKVQTVFNDNVYEEILSETLPDSEEKGINFKEAINKLLGFDTSKPETVLSEYSSVFEGTSEDVVNTAMPLVTEAPIESTPPAQVAQNEQSMPTKEQISASVGLKLNNATDYSVDIDSMCSQELALTEQTPCVLVMHTHTTECYDGDQMNGESERNTDGEKNVVAVGNEICKVLEENGIKTIHDTTYHDYPSYQGAYTRAMTTIENNIKNNPEINIVLDIHRDAFVYEDGTKLTVTSDQNGVSTAQVMLVAGTDSMGLWHDNWRENLKFAAKIQNAAEIMYPGLMRPINLRTERFNEHLTMGSLIIEVGSNGNTLEQAKEGGRDVARAIAAVLNSK